MRKLKNNKGFTLVEIIVVLVILAILAAAMIPAMLGYVEESRGKTYADQARVVYNACQTCATEGAALGAGNDEISTALNAFLTSQKTGAALEDSTAKSVSAKVRSLIGEDILASSPTMKVVLSTGEGSIAGHVEKVYYDSNGSATTGGYMVEVNITTGTTNVQKDTKDGSTFTWPADAPVTP